MRRTVLESIAWCVTAGVGFVLLTQTIGWDGGTIVAVLQSLTPIGLAAMIPVVAAAALARSTALSVAAGLVVLGLLVLIAPATFHDDHPAADDSSVGLTVASVNMLFDNDRVGELGFDLVRRSPDVIAFSEFVPWHRRTLKNIPQLSDAYPHRLDLDRGFGSGMAIWSKYPILDWSPADPNGRIVDATIDGPDGPLRLVSVHPRTPVSDFDAWREALEGISALVADSDDPTLVIGDFNATYWHPAFRRLLDTGLTDAHLATGDEWSTSWPIGRLIPPFVRLDHALTNDRLTVVELEDFQPPGSDHRAVTVTVAPTAVS